MSFDFDLIKAEWMNTPNKHPLYDLSQAEIKTQPDQDFPVGECHCDECEKVNGSEGLCSPLITTPRMMSDVSPWPLQKCDIVSSRKKSLPLLAPDTCKGMDMVTVLDPPQHGKRLLDAAHTLSELADPLSNVENIAPKKKRAKKVPKVTSGERSPDKVSEKKFIFHPHMGMLYVEECIGIVPGKLLTYQCVDRDFNTILIERFKFDEYDEELDLEVIQPDM